MWRRILKNRMWPILFRLGPIKVPGYGMMLAIGIILGIHLAKKQAKKENLNPQMIESIAFWVVIASVIGSRFLYTFVEHGDYYWRHPLEFFSFQKGGLAFSGSLVTAILTAIYLSKK